VDRVIAALEGISDPLGIDGLMLGIDCLIRTLVNLEDHPQMDEIIRLLGEACNDLTSEAQLRLVEEEAVDFAPQVRTQRRGRPAFEIKEEQLSFLLNEGFKIPTIALLLRVSTRIVDRRMKKYGLSVSGKIVGTGFVFLAYE